MMTEPGTEAGTEAGTTLADVCARLDTQNRLLAQLVDVFVKYEPTLAALDKRVNKPKRWGVATGGNNAD